MGVYRNVCAMDKTTFVDHMKLFNTTSLKLVATDLIWINRDDRENYFYISFLMIPSEILVRKLQK